MKKEKMRFLFCTHVYPPEGGGIAAFSRDIVGLLKRMGYEVRIFKDNNKNGINHQNKQKGNKLLKEVYIRIRFYFGFFVQIKKMLICLWKFKPNFVISSSWMPCGFMGVLIKPFFTCRQIIQVHGTEISGKFRKGWRKKILSIMFRSADMIWSNSFYTTQLLSIYNCKNNKIKIFYPFLPSEALRAAESFQNLGKKQPPIILTVAHLYPRKGIDLVLRALSDLKNLAWKYVVVGESPPPWSREQYENLAVELGIQNRVTFLGQIPREKVWNLMGQSTMFVMLSRAMENDIESFGIVYIEAQLFGLPCIGTRFGGIPEAIQDGVTGVLIENQDVKGLTSAIRALLRDPVKAKEMSQNGRRRVLRFFSEDARRKTVISFLKSIIYNNN